MTDFYDHSPVLSLIENHQANEDTPFKINVSATSPVGSQITYSASSDTSAIGVFIEQDSLVVWFQQDWTGLGNISVIANDENLLSDTTFFTVTVLPVNDPPSNFDLIFPTIFDTIPITINTDETIQFGWHRSNDVDSEISYDISVIIDHPNELFTKEYQGIFDTTFGIPSYDYAILMNDLELSNSNFSYFIEASDGGVFRSDDAGKTWEKVNENSALRQRAWYYSRIYADSQNKDKVYVMNVSYGVSTDGGLTLDGTSFAVVEGQGIQVSSAGVSAFISTDNNMAFYGSSLGISQFITGLTHVISTKY